METVREVAHIWAKVAIWFVPLSTAFDDQPPWAKLCLTLIVFAVASLFSYLVYYRAVQVEEGGPRG